jgi:dihydrodipicolinate synthase/N-acetylneuraminate lyase
MNSVFNNLPCSNAFKKKSSEHEYEENTKKKIFGIIPPVITSFKSNGEFDEEAQREVIRFLTPKVNGFYPIGTYGSGPLMNLEERKRAAEVILDEVDGRVLVIVHVGSITTAQTVELAKHAEQSGADAVGAIPPYYYRYPEEDLLDHFRAILGAVQIPVFVYNNPGLSNNPISANMMYKLAEEGLTGLKDSSFDLIQFYDFLNKIEQPDFIHIIGTEAMSAASVHAGACGIISGLANVWPELMAELWQALESNDGRAAGELQLRVLKARSILKLAPTLVVCYEVLRMRGVNAGLPGRPYSPLKDNIKKKVRDEFNQMGLCAA